MKLSVTIISHNHYDHLDYDSVVELNKKFGNEKSENGLNWCVGLGLFAFNRYDISKTLQNVEEVICFNSIFNTSSVNFFIENVYAVY